VQRTRLHEQLSDRAPPFNPQQDRDTECGVPQATPSNQLYASEVVAGRYCLVGSFRRTAELALRLMTRTQTGWG
jgi:hypothetical protein